MKDIATEERIEYVKVGVSANASQRKLESTPCSVHSILNQKLSETLLGKEVGRTIKTSCLVSNGRRDGDEHIDDSLTKILR